MAAGSSNIEGSAKEKDPLKGDLDMILGIKKSGLRMPREEEFK